MTEEQLEARGYRIREALTQENERGVKTVLILSKHAKGSFRYIAWSFGNVFSEPVLYNGR